MYRTILVPLDGSTFSEHALPLALSIARRADAALQVVHVHPPLATVYVEGAAMLDDTIDLQLRTQHRDYLIHVVERLGRLSDVPVKQIFLVGDIAATLRRAAANASADLVVMTTHGRGALGRFWLGSVADELIRELPMPLLLVRPHTATPAYDPEPEFKHVLLPLDGTALAEQMLAPAFQLGQLFDADYTVMRVIKPVLPMTYSIEGFAPTPAAESVLDQIERTQEGLCREAQGYIDGVARRLRDWAGAKTVTVRTQVAMEHQPATAILHEAVSPIDLIALETHGRRGLSRLFLGSVADKVIRGSAPPVLVHKPVH